MKLVLCTIWLCVVLLCGSACVFAQDIPTVQTAEELATELNATNDSVTQALDIDTDAEEENNYEQQNNDRLRQIVDEQAKEIPLYAEKNLDTSKWKKLITDEKLNYDPLKVAKIKEEVVEKPSTFDPTTWKNAMVVLLFVLVALAIVLIIYAFFGKQYFAKPEQKLQEEQDNWEDVEAFSAWDKAIADALSNNDYRLATRILYLQTLQQLNDTNWIQYSKEKLSNHYLQKLYGTQLYQPFTQCNKYFDYVWYGKYPLTEQSFADIRAQFIQLQNQVGAV
jgi:hypothetical protein